MKDLLERIKDLETINETHQQLNGELRSELQKAQSENIKSKNLLQGYKKVIEELTDKLRKRS
jgi:uncharacterized membrane protein YgaE (UPF0421/DUF939 family)|tara:strand:- start:335 stop:520 length:186 start_codon:yes stop_codon:yes gene_type:complete